MSWKTTTVKVSPKDKNVKINTIETLCVKKIVYVTKTRLACPIWNQFATRLIQNKHKDLGFNLNSLFSLHPYIKFLIHYYTTSATKKELQRKTLLYLWNEGVCNARELHAHTSIPLSTIYDNIKNLNHQALCWW